MLRSGQRKNKKQQQQKTGFFFFPSLSLQEADTGASKLQGQNYIANSGKQLA